MKQCSKCEQMKTLLEFPKRVAVANGLKAQCKSCVKIYKASLYLRNATEERIKRRLHYRSKVEYYRKKSVEYYKLTSKESNLRRRCKKRGITVDQYFEMLKTQNNKCEICLNVFNAKKDCAIDHCHETGKVRSLLCDNCNTMLGLSKESINTLERSIKYLQKYKN